LSEKNKALDLTPMVSSVLECAAEAKKENMERSEDARKFAVETKDKLHKRQEMFKKTR